MKKLIYFVIISLSMCLVSSCYVAKPLITDTVLGATSVIPNLVKTYKPDTLTINQVDSVIAVDQLPEFRYWKQSTFRDAESNQSVSYKTLYDPQSKLIYTMKPYKDKYIMFKKSVK